MNEAQAYYEEILRLLAERDRFKTALNTVWSLSELTAPDVRLDALIRISEVCETALQEAGDA